MTRKLFTLTALMLALAILAVGCAGNSVELKNTSWNLSELNGQPIVAGSAPTLAFDTERISGSGTCNSFGGDYTISGSKLTFGPIMSTMMACMENGLMEQESAYFQALGSTASYEVKDGQLRLLDSGGAVLAVFTQVK